MKCPNCNSTKVEKFVREGYVIIACSRCGYENRREI